MCSSWSAHAAGSGCCRYALGSHIRRPHRHAPAEHARITVRACRFSAPCRMRGQPSSAACRPPVHEPQGRRAPVVDGSRASRPRSTRWDKSPGPDPSLSGRLGRRGLDVSNCQDDFLSEAIFASPRRPQPTIPPRYEVAHLSYSKPTRAVTMRRFSEAQDHVFTPQNPRVLFMLRISISRI